MNFNTMGCLKTLPSAEGRAQVCIFSDVIGIAESLGSYLQKELVGKDAFYIALSGGSTPAVIFDELARTWKDRINWAALQVFWVDERYVPQDSEQSNYRMTVEHLLQKVPIATSQIHPVNTDLAAENAVAAYAEQLRSLPQENSLPCFDLVLLGMGEDGHTASIFPGQDELWETSDICVLSEHPQSRQTRITLSGKVINNAQQILIIANGAAKAQMLQSVFTSPFAKNLPITRVDVRRSVWLVDAAAAKSYLSF